MDLRIMLRKQLWGAWRVVVTLILIVVATTDQGWFAVAEDAVISEEPVADGAATYAAEIKEEQVDLDGNGVKEQIRVTWQPGGSDKPIQIEVFRGDELVQTLGHVMGGIQSNYALKDTDGDGRPELLIWSGLWDFRVPGEDGIAEDTYEGHSAAHRYMVATYKWMRDQFWIWDLYTTPEKYDPYPDHVPAR